MFNQDNSGKDAKNPDPSPQFNWKLIGFISLMVVLFGFAILGKNVIQKEPTNIQFSKFQDLWDQGLVVIGNKQQPLEYIEAPTSRGAILQGYHYEFTNERALDKNSGKNIFVQVDQKELSSLLGDNTVFKKTTAQEAPKSGEQVSIDTFKKLFKKGELNTENTISGLQVVQENGLTTIYAQQYEVLNAGVSTTPKKFKVELRPVLDQAALTKMEIGKYAEKKDAPPSFGEVFWQFFPVLAMVLIFVFIIRMQMKGGGKGAMGFGKSKAKLMSKESNKVTFKDVAGIDEAKEELYEIVDFLKDSKKFQSLGGRVPKGVLMVGSPGTGKTLMARAIAGEADVPFFSISGSDFVEMFVGVGASRVRDMFEQGKRNAPCLIFIDEIDAVGRHRGHGVGGGHDEREQTLNQMLVEMDGFDAQEGVIIIAATNRPDVLDPALLRPGRFDRRVEVSLPDVGGREEILKVHVKKIKLTEGTDLKRIARGTPGFSGAELGNLVNEAALIAARLGQDAVTLDHLEEARDKVRWGRERRSLAMSDKEKENTAYHEAGHTILNHLLEHTDPLHKVTIVPRGPYLGAMMNLPEDNKISHRKLELLDELVVIMGGRVAEEIFFGNVTNGASGDIKQATNIARKMVCEWGMSEKLGMVEYGQAQGEVFLARDMGNSQTYSEETAKAIDQEIKELIDHAYQKATQLILEHKDQLELISKALLEYETLDAAQIKELMDTGSLSEPPTSSTPPALPTDPAEVATDPIPSSPSDASDDEVDGNPAPSVVSPA